MSLNLAAKPALDAGLPKLPDGWHYEPHCVDADVMHVVWPEHGAVSVHLKRRSTATGWCVPDPARHGTVLRSGRNWKIAVIADAVEMLQAAWR